MATPAILKNTKLNQRIYNKEALDEMFNGTVGLPSYNEDTQTITFTRKDGATIDVRIPLFDMPFTLDVDEASKEIVFKFEDNTEKRVPMSELLIAYEGTIGEQIQVKVEGSEISAGLLEGSVTEEHLTPELQSKLGDTWVVEDIV